MLAIEAREVRKTFGGLTAVDGVSFTVEPGEFFGLLGPNGAGKTSLIRMLYGFSPLSGGSLRVFDMDVTQEWRTVCSRLGVCQQDNTLDPDLTVEQNLRLYASYFDIPKNTAWRRTEELLEFFALGHKRNARVNELSGGMARRLQLARAMINEPQLLILDEPTTGLDPQSRHQVWDKLRALGKRGLTLLLTTHYMEEAANLCSRLLIIDHGRVLVGGAPKDLIDEHVGERVVEVEDPSEALAAFVKEKELMHDVLGNRLYVYGLREGDEEQSLLAEIQERFSPQSCATRRPGLEDVFLRLTGRELRE